MKVSQLFNSKKEVLAEGFWDFSVHGSDSAFDLVHRVKEAVKREKEKIKRQTGGIAPDNVILKAACISAIQQLKKAFRDKGDQYNTHGTLNVAMIMVEEFDQFRSLKMWKEFAAEVAEKLHAEAKARRSQKDEYTQEMYRFAKEVKKLAQ